MARAGFTSSFLDGALGRKTKSLRTTTIICLITMSSLEGFLRRRKNPSNELIVIKQMIVVVRRDFVFLPNAPSKKLLVKPARAILIGRAQVSDTECTGKAFNAEATAGPRLP